MKIWKKIVSGVAIFLFIVMAGFIIWGESAAQAMPEAIASLESDAHVYVETGKWLVFQPTNQVYRTGLIFYPGGRVDYRAYAPMAHELAAQGYLVVIPRMPLNLAVFGIEKAQAVIQTYPGVDHWFIGGHSLGGSMAAHFLNQHQSELDGLIFLASYPASSDDLSNYPGKVLSISGSLDGLATPEKIDASRILLPSDTSYFEISGGNHAYFGWYGDQSGDQPATISRADQQGIILEEINHFLKSVNSKP